MTDRPIPPVCTAEDAVREAVAAEMQLLDPAVRRSRERAEALLDPEFVEVGASGRQWDRSHMLAELPTMTGANNNEQVEVSALRGVLLAPGLVHLTYETHRDGRHVLRCSLWRKNNAAAEWRMYYHQGTPAPASESFAP
ncbi:nuclear transport factor 2 family protein [Nocardia salmonicida]|uniref:nuclear transport factor 2 family protein n=1 Tax=Nocardia salmonicida TaxID=53431 RepID=UPI0007A5512E|nr:DUF4440 domain-containing protein [Nocardia salmonicida]MBC7299447.1 DUF4440 domain-containing protein [Nocardia sp.]